MNSRQETIQTLLETAAPSEPEAAVAVAEAALDEEDTLLQEVHDLQRAAHLSLEHTRPPAAVPGYSISRSLGEGAYGSVWLAVEQNTGKQVAVKFYTHRRGLDWSLLNREVEKMAVLYTSRNIVGLEAVGWESDPPYYVMEYLENGSLAELLADGPLPAGEAVRIARAILQALVHAHGAGILHCDLKPANVLLDANYEPRICDFGQSRLSHEQNPALGTLFYMAPEQADLTAVPDARWDVYALGAILYHMLTGEAPYRTPENERRIREAGTLQERLASYRRVLRHSPRPTAHRKVRGADKRLVEIVERCLRIDPEKRYPNAQAVLDELETRERYRARRPLMTLGIVGPALLLGAMTIVARNAFDHAVQEARGNQVRRALESEALSARILARSLERDLGQRIADLKEYSRNISKHPAMHSAVVDANQLRDPDRRQKLIAGWPDRQAALRELANEKMSYNEERKDQNLPEDISWFITDGDGYQIWRDPYDIDTMGKRYHWREYFNGKAQFDPRSSDAPQHVEPINRPHISLPFVSQSTGQYMVAISVPIFDDPADPVKVIGVLARTIGLGELLREFGREITSETISVGPADGVDQDVDRIWALVAPSRRDADARRWILLDHPWLQRAEIRSKLRDLLTDAKVDDRSRKQQLDSLLTFEKRDAFPVPGGRKFGMDADYHDPAAQHDPGFAGAWLASFSRVDGTGGWTVVVQESREKAMAPVNEMESTLQRYGLWALAVFLGVLALVWAFVWRAVTERAPRSFTARSDRPWPSNGTATASDA